MTIGSDEGLPVEYDPASAINDALIGFTGCVGESVLDLCSYGLTIGETYVPFDPDPDDECEEGEAACSQLWVRVMQNQPSYQEDSFGGDCGGVFRLSLEVGILRCIEIEDDGEAPTATNVMVAAAQAMTDMQRIYCAAMSCEVWDSIEVGTWTPMGPLGGQYGGIWTFEVETTGAPAAVPSGGGGRVVGLWTGHGPPDYEGLLLRARDGDEYLDLDSGTVYEIHI